MVDLTGLELVGAESEILEAEIKCESAARLLAQLRSLIREKSVSDAYLNTLPHAKLVDSAEKCSTHDEAPKTGPSATETEGGT